MLGVDEEDYYNPTIIQSSATRKKDEEEIHLHDIPQIKVYHFVVCQRYPQGYIFLKTVLLFKNGHNNAWLHS